MVMMTTFLRNGRCLHRFAKASGFSRACGVGTSFLETPSSPALMMEDYCRRFSTRSGGSDSSKKSFRPRRRSSPEYRPVPTATASMKKKKRKQEDSSPGNDKKFVHLGHVENPKDELEAQIGPVAADVVRSVRRELAKGRSLDETVEEYLRMADYITAEEGTTEALVAERRALAEEFDDLQEREDFMKTVDDTIREGRIKYLRFGPGADNGDGSGADGNAQKKTPEELLGLEDRTDSEDRDPELNLDPNQLAHGEWSEMLIGVDRNIKLWRGGRLESYRALVVGGNLNGCGGFGIGKAPDPLVAVDVAGRHCKRNIFFVDRYQGCGLTRDLVGKQNSCVVTLRATDNGLRGNELCREILKRFGVSSANLSRHLNEILFSHFP